MAIFSLPPVQTTHSRWNAQRPDVKLGGALSSFFPRKKKPCLRSGMPDLRYYLTLCNIKTTPSQRQRHTRSPSSVATWYRFKADSKPCENTKQQITTTTGLFHLLDQLSIYIFILLNMSDYLFFFSLLPPASFYLCVIYDVCCFINRFCLLFFSSSLPLRSSPLKRLFHRKCKLPAAAVDSRTSEAKLWVWMLEESIKFSPPRSSSCPTGQSGVDLATSTTWAAARRLPNLKWWSETNVTASRWVVWLLWWWGGRKDLEKIFLPPFCQLSRWAVDVVYLYKCCTTVITSGMAYYCVQLIYFYSI